MRGGEELIKILAGSLRGIVERAPFSFEGLQEVKLRTGRPFLCRYEGREYGFLETGEPVATGPEGGENSTKGLRKISGSEDRKSVV